MTSLEFPAIGTHWKIDLFQDISNSKVQKIKRIILKRIEEFDSNYSRFKKNSWVVKCSRGTGTYKLPSDAAPLLKLYESLYRDSGGLFTPLIGRTLEDAGYDAQYSLKPKAIISKPPKLEDAIVLSSKEITFKTHILLDFGAAGKGYLVDLISNILMEEDVKSFCMDASGDIFHQDQKAIRVALEHPDNPRLAIGIWEIQNKSICGSSGNRRKWDRFHHTINPFTLNSPDEIKAVWTVADNAMLADALATCLFLDPNPQHYRNFKFEYVLLYKDNKALKSSGFSGELFTNESA